MDRKTRPILFKGEMVKAILEGRKTQTRRIVVPSQTAPRVAPLTMEPWIITGKYGPEWQTYDDGRLLWTGYHPDYPSDEHAKWFACDYGEPGDRLWVRETHACPGDGQVVYRADHGDDWAAYGLDPDFVALNREAGIDPVMWRWRPSIHMPRWASRIELEVVDVRVEQVQDISEVDVKAEGVSTDGNDWQDHFKNLWDGINLKRGYGWDVNPYVWVIEFKCVEVLT